MLDECTPAADAPEAAFLQPAKEFERSPIGFFLQP